MHTGDIMVSLETYSLEAFLQIASVGREGFCIPTPVGAAPTSSNLELLRACALSPDERAIVRVIAEKAPVATKVLYPAANLEKSRGATLVGNLRARGVIRLVEDGYVLADPTWLEIANQTAS